MYFASIVVLLLCDLTRALHVPVDTVIVQVQQWVVVGAQQRVLDQVLLNGVSLTGPSQEVKDIIQSMSADSHPLIVMGINHTAVLKNHTVLRSRECILEGSQLHWADRVFYDGTVYLTLDHTDVWTAHAPQALALKALWDEARRHTKAERLRLQEGCITLMKELKLSEAQTVPGILLPQFLIPILAILAFTGLIIISLLLAKNQGPRHPGGVIGSVVHYPSGLAEELPETKGFVYRTL